jgi:hypothetical protein
MVAGWGGPDNRTVARFSVQLANPLSGPDGVIRDPLGPPRHGKAPTYCGIRRTSNRPSSLVGNGPTPSTHNGWRRRLLHPPVGMSGMIFVAGLGDATGDGPSGTTAPPPSRNWGTRRSGSGSARTAPSGSSRRRSSWAATASSPRSPETLAVLRHARACRPDRHLTVSEFPMTAGGPALPLSGSTRRSSSSGSSFPTGPRRPSRPPHAFVSAPRVVYEEAAIPAS